MATDADQAELAAAIAELVHDPHTWMARHFWIRNKQKQIVLMAPNGIQRDLYRREQAQRKRLGYVRQYILKARQGGITTYQQARNLHHIWSNFGSDALTVADKLERTVSVFEITDRAVKRFTPGLLPTVGGKRAKEVSFPGLESTFRTDTAGGEPGRGLTLGKAHLSEFAHFEEPMNTLSAIDGAITTDGDIVLETTGSVYEDEAHKFWDEAQKGQNDYDAIFYPWWRCDPVTYRLPLDEPDELGPLSDEEAMLVREHGLDLEQVKWRRSKIRNNGTARFMREYAEDEETCWMAAGELFYDAGMLKMLLNACARPIATVDGLSRYQDVLPAGDRMIIGCDIAEGAAGDRTTWEARGFKLDTLMSTFESRLVTPEEFADKLVTYARPYHYPLIVVEKNAHGITVLRRLRDVHRYPVRRLFHRQTIDRDTHKPTTVVGWYTDGTTQPMLLDYGRQMFVDSTEQPARRITRQVVKDAFGIRRNKEGKIKLTGRDAFVAAALVRAGREYPHLPLGTAIPGSVITSPF